MPMQRQCDGCLLPKKGVSRKCGGCRGARYCSVECQRSDWKRHKDDCRFLTQHPDIEANRKKLHTYMCKYVDYDMAAGVAYELFIESKGKYRITPIPPQLLKVPIPSRLARVFHTWKDGTISSNDYAHEDSFVVSSHR